MGLVWASDGGLLTWNPTLCMDMLQEAYEMTWAAGKERWYPRHQSWLCMASPPWVPLMLTDIISCDPHIRAEMRLATSGFVFAFCL